MMNIRLKFQLKLVIWTSCFVLTAAGFSCPTKLNVCSCGQSIQWWENDWTNVTYVNCTNLLLHHVPDFSPLIGQPFHRLLLNNNNITGLKDEDFRNLSVKEIVLSKNRIRKIPKYTFSSLRSKLEYLSLDRNKLKLDKGLQFLKGLKRLKYLDLGFNLLADKYKEFPGNLFRDLNLTSLRTLTLQTLQMSKLMEGTFIGIEQLEQLDLSYNFLPEFPLELLKLKNLKGLKLYSNEIMILKNDTFSNLTNLRQLLVGVNEIKLEPGAFNGLEESIEEINLYHNPLYRVPTEAIQNLGNLKKLSLVKTRLESIENGSFVGDYELEELHLDDNPKLNFSDVGMFHGIEESLKILHISRMDWETLPLKVLRRMTNLTRLDASTNRIQRVDKHFFRHLKLTTILLGWNSIKHVDHRAFRDLPNGVILNLNQNNMHNISFILEVEECTFEKIFLYGNRIKCDCTLEKVLNSGLVSWGLLGACYMRKGNMETWYDFNDPELMKHFKENCDVTTPYASCFRASASSGAVRIGDFISAKLLVCLLLLGCILSYTR